MNIKLLTETAKIPALGTVGAACWDVCSDQDAVVPPGGRSLIKLGFAAEVPLGYELQIRPRSGLAIKHGVFAHFGTIDYDYRGEIGVILFNLGNEPFSVVRGDRIAQMALCRVTSTFESIDVVSVLSETKRGTGGFGSTGLH